MESKIYNIGVDVSPLTRPLSGIGRYTIEILARILRSPHHFFLYSPRPPVTCGFFEELLSSRENVTERYGNWNWRFSGVAWGQTVMPWKMLADRLDIFWSPAHRFPLYINKNVARVLTIHDLVWKYHPKTMRPLNRLLEAMFMPRSIKMADKVIAVSKCTAEAILEEFDVKLDTVEVNPLGSSVLDRLYSRNTTRSFKSLEPYVLFVGTHEPRKNLERLIEAFARLSSTQRRGVSLLIVGGEGWGNVGVERLITKFHLNRSVFVLGRVSDHELAELYAHALFLAMPSIYEGFGLPLLEAMARGTPVLTSNCSSMPEVVGSAGYLIDPLDVEAIKIGLFELITDKELRKKLASECMSRASIYNWDEAAKKTLDIFTNAVGLRKKRI